MKKVFAFLAFAQLFSFPSFKCSTDVEPLWPLQVGKIWQYAVEDDQGGQWTNTVEVAGIENRCSTDGYYRVILCSSRSPGDCETTYYRSTETGFYECGEEGAVDCPIFRIDVPVGQEWECNGSYTTRLADADVTVPYGIFEEANYFHMDEGPEDPDCNLWFHLAPGTGILRTRDECSTVPHTSVLTAICNDPHPESPGDTCPVDKGKRVIPIIASLLLEDKSTSPTCVDADGDGYGNPASASCTHLGLDCDDTNADVYAEAPELCDGVDNQCPGDTGYGEVDEVCVWGPGVPDTGIMKCYDNTQEITCPAPRPRTSAVSRLII